MLKLLCIITLFFPFWVVPDNSEDEKSLREIIHNLRTETGYHILYRDALVAGKTAIFHTGENWQHDFLSLLHSLDLDATIDAGRRQILIFKKSPPIKEREIEGYVIDNVTGARLPFATIVWQGDSGIQSGTQTDIEGKFRIHFKEAPPYILSVSYVGYSRQVIHLRQDQLREIGELSFRLLPSAVEISEIVIQGQIFSGVSDTVYSKILDVGTFSPLGESNTVRMLHTLPSVTQGPSFLDGSFVRGSDSDALQVLLDGSVIYNRAHLFGLIDSFNPDVIRAGSFHYNITPARYQGPPGGTLELVTKTGSLYQYKGNIGLSNSVVRGSLEGPFSKGKASWLLAGRYSILDWIDWLNSDELIAWGLDIGRKTSLSDTSLPMQGKRERVVTPGEYHIGFYDLHGKIFIEPSEKNRFMISGYSGANTTEQLSDRIMRNNPGGSFPGVRVESFLTQNEWGNHSANAAFIRNFRTGYTAELYGGLSYYHSLYLKEDFSYQRPGVRPGEQIIYVDAFELESELTHGYGGITITAKDIKAGVVLNGYRSSYLERSLNRPEFFQRTTPYLAESFIETNINQDPYYRITAGARVHYFSEEARFQISPRLYVNMWPWSPLSFSAGYSRNFQYLHNLNFYNLTTADIWLIADDVQKPSKADQVTAGIHLRPWATALFQVEGYIKWQENIRLHELDFQSIQNPLEGTPWFYENEGISNGIEFLVRQDIRRFQFTQTYTYSSAKLRNERLNGGDWFFAYWDRRHQYNTLFTVNIHRNLAWNLNWYNATGAPNRLELFSSSEIPRLGNYRRLDTSVNYSASFSGQFIQVQAGVYNLFDRQNPWYREWVEVLESGGGRPNLIPAEADVYDLGMQLSFSVSYHF